MNAVRLTRAENGWRYRDFLVERREWILPYAHTSYRIVKDGQTIDDCDTLREVRQVLADLIPPA